MYYYTYNTHILAAAGIVGILVIAVVLTVFDGKTREEILSLDVAAVFARLGLADHLSPSRRNGLGAMVEKIRFYASEG